MKGYKVFFVILAGALCIWGCDKLPFLKPKTGAKAALGAPPAGASVVARVGNFYVTAEDLNKEVENFNVLVTAQGMAQNKLDTRDKRVAYLRNEIVRKYILYQEALDRGIEKKPEVVRAIENGKVNLVVTELLRQEIEKISVSPKEVEDFYNQNKNFLKEPEQRKVFEIVLPSEDEAKQVYIELLKGGDFAALARQYSKAPTSGNGGDLGFMALEIDPKKRTKFEKFYEVAFAPTLEEGGISSIFKGPDGYYILKINSIKRPEARALSDLWNNIKNWLLFEKQQKAIADLASKLSGETKVEVYEGKVE